MKVIADIGSNWNTLDDSLNAIAACKKAEIDYVKFQYFTHEKLYGFPGKMKGELPKEWIPLIHKHCVEVGIEFMCSVFEPNDVEFINQYVDIHKIASSENDYLKLIRAVESTKKPYLLSQGCVMEYDRGFGSSYRQIPMACIPEYPTDIYPIEQLVRFSKCITEDDRGFGLSDHNPSDFGYELAYRFGCSYYEFHFNPLKIKSADSAHSRTTFTKKDFPEYERKPGRIFVRPRSV
jgi:sialic acid synthase SpsE